MSSVPWGSICVSGTVLAVAYMVFVTYRDSSIGRFNRDPAGEVTRQASGFVTGGFNVANAGVDGINSSIRNATDESIASVQHTIKRFGDLF